MQADVGFVQSLKVLNPIQCLNPQYASAYQSSQRLPRTSRSRCRLLARMNRVTYVLLRCVCRCAKHPSHLELLRRPPRSVASRLPCPHPCLWPVCVCVCAKSLLLKPRSSLPPTLSTINHPIVRLLNSNWKLRHVCSTRRRLLANLRPSPISTAKPCYESLRTSLWAFGWPL